MEIDLHETINQLGGGGLRGALVYIGTKHIIKGKDYVGLIVNGKLGYRWMIKITLDFSDTYIVELLATRGDKTEQLARQENVYCDELQGVVEQMYDGAIKEHNKSVIPGVGIIGKNT
ncbi:MAG TPA: hypothetical protein VNG51_19225 [Ktedonobacteraceae bacterium]|nr:hypothetical protein [Ktedonobacteraceae bacterium]